MLSKSRVVKADLTDDAIQRVDDERTGIAGVSQAEFFAG
jgi:hypothetical protein